MIFAWFVSLIEPKNINEAILDELRILSMKEELEQFIRNKVWFLMPRPKEVNIIGTKLIHKNKIDEIWYIVQNKARLVAQGYIQIEGVDFNETLILERFESIQFLVGMACELGFKLEQIDIKSAFWTVTSKKRCMWNNPSDSKIQIFPTMCTSYINHFMSWNKHP